MSRLGSVKLLYLVCWYNSIGISISNQLYMTTQLTTIEPNVSKAVTGGPNANPRCTLENFNKYSPCGVGFVRISDLPTCIWFSDVLLTFEQNYYACKIAKMSLVKIQNKKFEDALNSILRYPTYWIGLVGRSNGWYWKQSDEALEHSSYSNWFGGFPPEANASVAVYKCKYNSGKWRSQNRDIEIQGACTRDFSQINTISAQLLTPAYTNVGDDIKVKCELAGYMTTNVSIVFDALSQDKQMFPGFVYDSWSSTNDEITVQEPEYKEILNLCTKSIQANFKKKATFKMDQYCILCCGYRYNGEKLCTEPMNSPNLYVNAVVSRAYMTVKQDGENIIALCTATVNAGITWLLATHRKVWKWEVYTQSVTYPLGSNIDGVSFDLAKQSKTDFGFDTNATMIFRPNQRLFEKALLMCTSNLIGDDIDTMSQEGLLALNDSLRSEVYTTLNYKNVPIKQPVVTSQQSMLGLHITVICSAKVSHNGSLSWVAATPTTVWTSQVPFYNETVLQNPFDPGIKIHSKKYALLETHILLNSSLTLTLTKEFQRIVVACFSYPSPKLRSQSELLSHRDPGMSKRNTFLNFSSLTPSIITKRIIDLNTTKLIPIRCAAYVGYSGVMTWVLKTTNSSQYWYFSDSGDVDNSRSHILRFDRHFISFNSINGTHITSEITVDIFEALGEDDTGEIWCYSVNYTGEKLPERHWETYLTLRKYKEKVPPYFVKWNAAFQVGKYVLPAIMLVIFIVLCVTCETLEIIVLVDEEEGHVEQTVEPTVEPTPSCIPATPGPTRTGSDLSATSNETSIY